MFSKYFNGTTLQGRANVARATYGSILMIYLFFRMRKSNTKQSQIACPEIQKSCAMPHCSTEHRENGGHGGHGSGHGSVYGNGKIDLRPEVAPDHGGDYSGHGAIHGGDNSDHGGAHGGHNACTCPRGNKSESGKSAAQGGDNSGHGPTHGGNNSGHGAGHGGSDSGHGAAHGGNNSGHGAAHGENKSGNGAGHGGKDLEGQTANGTMNAMEEQTKECS